MGGTFELNTIYTGDARKLSKSIPDESIDLCLCDPVYQNIDDYAWLSETCARILKPGGNLIAQYGHYYQIEVLNAMNPHLDFVWPLVQWMPGQHAKHYGNKIVVRHKPYAWFSKGKRMGRFVFDMIDAPKKSKQHHAWGDNPAIFVQLILRLTDSNSVIFDPFCGGGTIPLSAKMCGHNWLAFEIDPETAEKARRRVYEASFPLMVVEQDELSF